jgi:type VI secretion system protein
VTLTLELTSPQSAGASRHTFHEDGGSIGRESGNAWVLPHSKVSASHAVITHRDGVFYIEDRSRNGVALNSSKNRLARGRPYALTSGDRILIDPYEIRVSIAREQSDRPEPAAGSLGVPRDVDSRFDASDPFDLDPFASAPVASSRRPSPDADVANQELDPLELLDLVSRRPPSKPAPQAKDLALGSLLDGHYQPPVAVPESAFESPADSTSIPEDYDPLAPDDPVPVAAAPKPVLPPRRDYQSRSNPIAPVPVSVDHPPAPDDAPSVRAELPDSARGSPGSTADFADVLAGAGLDRASLTPEVAREFGQILRVVVAGVMDVMRSRQQIKDEFRMQGTRVRPVDNNPLKFSANVDDALHNLLMKRNRAYMGPVDAFEDAFDDLRHHQVAMLAGMRTAFEAMLAEFDPDHLQQEFDRQLAKGLVPAKLRYWESYRDRQQQAAKDPEATFRRLFGEEFARAYEHQLRALKSRERKGEAGGSPPSKPPET